VLDCRGYALTMVSTTADPQIALRFTQLRSSDGSHCGRQPANTASSPCRLGYPAVWHEDGSLFRAREMEDKWDIFLFDSRLYFARSWTGDLAYTADVTWESSRAIVTQVAGCRQPNVSENLVAVVDFLIKCYMYGVEAPHPLPAVDNASDHELALWSFARYGRRGVYGTYADVTHLLVRQGGDGRYYLESRG
jgi:hypothetical protein